MKTKQRDFQRSRLYTAEYPVRNRGNQFATVARCEEYVSGILKSKWWKKRAPYIDYIEIKDGRGRKNAAAFDLLRIISLPRWARCEIVILHELAHIIMPAIYGSEKADVLPNHGREFAKTFLALVGRYVSKEAAGELRKRFREAGVKWTTKK